MELDEEEKNEMSSKEEQLKVEKNKRRRRKNNSGFATRPPITKKPKIINVDTPSKEKEDEIKTGGGEVVKKRRKIVSVVISNSEDAPSSAIESIKKEEFINLLQYNLDDLEGIVDSMFEKESGDCFFCWEFKRGGSEKQENSTYYSLQLNKKRTAVRVVGVERRDLFGSEFKAVITDNIVIGKYISLKIDDRECYIVLSQRVVNSKKSSKLFKRLIVYGAYEFVADLFFKFKTRYFFNVGKLLNIYYSVDAEEGKRVYKSTFQENFTKIWKRSPDLGITIKNDKERFLVFQSDYVVLKYERPPLFERGGGEKTFFSMMKGFVSSPFMQKQLKLCWYDRNSQSSFECVLDIATLFSSNTLQTVKGVLNIGNLDGFRDERRISIALFNDLIHQKSGK